ncbi:MAG: right-handed parallel beta-helix repeat-containing protein, partial [Anaerolineaceae bacterium]|nr:right-handed parallel beta-helix repeat-containing protein [Anaerolineaceae bacterium]
STGVHVLNGNSNIIGGYSQGQRNVFLTSQYGVLLSSGLYNSVFNNYFGTATGDTIPGVVAGEYGIFAYTENTEIADNLIVGYSLAGIRLYYSDDNIITDNIIGLDYWKQSALGNEIGIDIGWSDSNTIGPNNVIAGNNSHGITTSQVDNTTISGNMIGYPYSTVPIGNGGDGIHLHAATNSTINSNNIIDSNSGNGVWLDFEDVTIQGNFISNNEMDGIYIEGNDSQIGGNTSQERNVINTNTGNGVHLVGANNITISGNYIGLDSAGAFDYGNEEFGILIEDGSSNNVIGGIGGNRNLIAFNGKTGIQIEGATTMNNQVIGNVLGAPIHWAWAAGNGWHGIGIYDGAHDNQIGTNDFGNGNIVLASGWSGIVIVNSSNNSVVGNRIGTDGDSIQWGNNFYGVGVVGNGIANIISNNEIAFNGSVDRLDEEEAGIKIDYSWGNTISQNSIHDNDGPGIQLVSGGNTDLPAPTITQASCTGGVSGTAGGPAWIIEIFSDGSDEGRIYEATVISGGSGWVWKGKPSGPNLIATARAQSNDTSQFSVPFNIGICDKYIYLPLIMKNYP